MIPINARRACITQDEDITQMQREQSITNNGGEDPKRDYLSHVDFTPRGWRALKILRETTLMLLQYLGTSFYDIFNSRVFIMASVIYHSSIISRNIGRRADAAMIFAVTGLYKSMIPSEAILES